MPTTDLPNAPVRGKIPVTQTNPKQGTPIPAKNVSGPITSTDFARFIVGVSIATKIDPRVLIAWAKAEGAYASNGTGHFNYFNLRPYPGDPYSGVSSGNFEQFSNVNDAIKATVRRLNQPFARPIIATAAAKPTPRQQIEAIAATGWDSGHYGGHGGISLQNIFGSMFGGQQGLNDSYVGPGSAMAIASTVGTGSAADAGSVDSGSVDKAGNKVVSGAASAANSAAKHIPGVAQIENVGSAIGWLFSIKGAEVIGGSIIVILGILSLFKSQMSSTPLGAAAKFIPGK